jgi:hypothetical protein
MLHETVILLGEKHLQLKHGIKACDCLLNNAFSLQRLYGIELLHDHERGSEKGCTRKGSRTIPRYYPRTSVKRPKITTNNVNEIPRREQYPRHPEYKTDTITIRPLPELGLQFLRSNDADGEHFRGEVTDTSRRSLQFFFNLTQYFEL